MEDTDDLFDLVEDMRAEFKAYKEQVFRRLRRLEADQLGEDDPDDDFSEFEVTHIAK